ncbi:MAG: M1 family metallopeptidase [Ignavibacteria bacterium]|nr:M1 family metallopeptidase [Ignavibacteria bacterium]MCU7517289.1 M1 family metallopeptidase [Ignavibacteria bacterium]
MKTPSSRLQGIMLPVLLTALFTIANCRDCFAQSNELYVPLNIKRALSSETRTLNGQPGKNYWQNSSNYRIKASLDPLTNVLTGSETVTYFNNSPDTLKELVIRLYGDIAAYGAVRDFPVSKGFLSEGVRIEKVNIAGEEVDTKNPKEVNRTGTNMILKLPGKLMPKNSIELQIKWNFTMPKASFRMGSYGDSTFMVAYWYPQVAVYDDIDGWDRVDYTGTVEFYNDFSNYDVELTEPQGVTLWATGELQNAEEIFQEKSLERINKAITSETVVNIITKEDLLKKDIYRSADTHTWRFKAEHVPDFAFAMSSHYLWDALSVEVDTSSHRRSFISAAYNDTAKDFYSVAEIARKTVKSLSFNFPGVPFPYPCLTVFNG